MNSADDCINESQNDLKISKFSINNECGNDLEYFMSSNRSQYLNAECCAANNHRNIYNSYLDKISSKQWNSCSCTDLPKFDSRFNPTSSLFMIHHHISSLQKEFYSLSETCYNYSSLNKLLVSLKPKLTFTLLCISLPNYIFIHSDSSLCAVGVGLYCAYPM